MAYYNNGNDNNDNNNNNNNNNTNNLNNLNAPTHVDGSDVVESALSELKNFDGYVDAIFEETYDMTDGHDYWLGHNYDPAFDHYCNLERIAVDNFKTLSKKFNDKTVELFTFEMNFDPSERGNPSRDANNDIAYANLLTVLGLLQHRAIMLEAVTEIREYMGRKVGKDPVNPLVPNGYVLRHKPLYDEFPRDAEAGFNQLMSLPAELISEA